MDADRLKRLRDALPPAEGDESIAWTAVNRGDLRAVLADIDSLTKWAKLAFRALNNVGPALVGVEGKTCAENDMLNTLRDAVDAAAYQYPTILGVRYIDAVMNARQALQDLRK